MIQSELYWHDARVWHQSVRGFQSHNTTCGSRDPYGASLVSPGCHVNLSSSHLYEKYKHLIVTSVKLIIETVCGESWRVRALLTKKGHVLTSMDIQLELRVWHVRTHILSSRTQQSSQQ